MHDFVYFIWMYLILVMMRLIKDFIVWPELPLL